MCVHTEIRLYKRKNVHEIIIDILKLFIVTLLFTYIHATTLHTNAFVMLLLRQRSQISFCFHLQECFLL